MQAHGKHGYTEKHFLSERDPLHGPIQHGHKEEQVAESSEIKQADGVQAQKSCQADADGLRHIGKRRGGNRRVGGADIGSQRLNLCGALRSVLPVQAQAVKQLVGGLLQRFAQLRCLFPALSRHLQIAGLIRLIHKIPVQVFYPGILRPQEHPAIPVPLGLPGHL